MSEKQKIAARLRWNNTSVEERARLGKLHSEVMIKYHAAKTPEERVALATRAAGARWNNVTNANS